MFYNIPASTSKERYNAMQASLKKDLSNHQPLVKTMQNALLATNTIDTIECSIYLLNKKGQVEPEQYVQDNAYAAFHLNQQT